MHIWLLHGEWQTFEWKLYKARFDSNREGHGFWQFDNSTHYYTVQITVGRLLKLKKTANTRAALVQNIVAPNTKTGFQFETSPSATLSLVGQSLLCTVDCAISYATGSPSYSVFFTAVTQYRSVTSSIAHDSVCPIMWCQYHLSQCCICLLYVLCCLTLRS